MEDQTAALLHFCSGRLVASPPDGVGFQLHRTRDADEAHAGVEQSLERRPHRVRVRKQLHVVVDKPLAPDAATARVSYPPCVARHCHETESRTWKR